MKNPKVSSLMIDSMSLMNTDAQYQAFAVSLIHLPLNLNFTNFRLQKLDFTCVVVAAKNPAPATAPNAILAPPCARNALPPGPPINQPANAPAPPPTPVAVIIAALRPQKEVGNFDVCLLNCFDSLISSSLCSTSCRVSVILA
mmetsp:Transcript_36420/g.43525  ORF Transcript_36420/g.43525 Transcript_36420/m.43525 type:complete len:143 (+) Transcript_36420:43-471(+)